MDKGYYADMIGDIIDNDPLYPKPQLEEKFIIKTPRFYKAIIWTH